MKFPLTAEEEEFRCNIRDFCADNLPSEISEKVVTGVKLSRDDYVEWQRILARGGLLCGAWPAAHGGHDWSPIKAYLFDEECGRAGAPWLLPFGVNYVGPVIHTYGSEEQKARYLPEIASAQTFWCQGYSEPEAGSDLAGLKMRAVRDGDHYIVSGRKIWTTMAHWADRIFCLVRTDPDVRPQAGISFLLVDLRSPGISIRPIMTMDGRHDLNEVLFEDVRVPVADRVGEENGGWTIAKFLLSNERLLVAEIGKQKRLMEAVRSILSGLADGDAPLSADRAVQARIVELETRLLALEWSALRTVRAAATGHPPAAAVSMLKVRGSELEQALTEFAVEIMGPEAMVYAPKMGLGDADPSQVMRNGAMARMLWARCVTIYGGSNEIQRNIIAKSLIGF
ncbi:MAG: acyl-CoA dehydrogenase family protein [Sphingobium sp.]|uniref:acyl-CoA dehydrogenase family protein n=1 Tax=Sphingobium sp. TaxID=1912891 RepID=UPI0029AF1FA7|nr:acyl-CoA dehydrogenase family protein [Sphingobium sp.]MDX3909555.1 acyl-CoA dehydrogenase family protein [Sphingobium sp.]